MSETRYRFGTYCYCFECGANWENDLEAHDCRVGAPESPTSPRAERDLFPISPSESPLVDVLGLPSVYVFARDHPYEFVKALARAQGGRCSCGRCDK